ncbi:hypothetical protein L915_18772 [Plasmopara halstedii]|uniref:Uncharacterized protein n=1 Tax=Plasmopara halstedii TaxID=4781 RepID=A0A0P1AI74_PLAHL|nr:hypothetical protein L915_18772 [Plasmopara halstedii]CEG40546.1 hypothetical protein L915_18772 [Plasmopara halstedii]|eukprot:XP_024576915.1 hypothetical protein L915_18772 [Plasmopara halstedii]
MLRLIILTVLVAPSSSVSVGRILHFSDVHLNISDGLTTENLPFSIRYFQDASLPLFESALQYAKQHVVADPDLFLYTGDHAVHGLFTDAYISEAVKTNVHVMEKYYKQKSWNGLQDVTAIIGNADANPDYHMELTNPEMETNPSIELISNAWKDSLSAANMDLFNRRGYLTYALDDKLEVITLNTVPYSPSHLPDSSEQPDPFGQFAWLDKTLAKLQSSGKFAYIAGHIAPIVDSYGGDPQWHPKYIVKYKNIVGKYAHVVKGQFFGHVHMIEFRVPVPSLEIPTEADSTFQLMPMYISGAISPIFGNNPSFIVWNYDPDTYDVLDYSVYSSNITESETQLDWKLSFKASEAYGLRSLSLSELSAFVRRAEQNVSLIENYHWNTWARSPNAPPCKDSLCHVKAFCTLKWWTTKGEYLACIDSFQSKLPHDYMSVSRNDTPSTVDYALSFKDVVGTIGETVVVIVAAISYVVFVGFMLQRAGILKNRSLYETVDS